MGKSYQNMGKQDMAAPRCPACGAARWEVARPARLARARHPQERKGAFERGVSLFFSSLLGVGALLALGVVAQPLLPAWAVWAMAAAVIAAMLSAVVVIDGLAVESKSCAVVCADCGEGFPAPWRPNH